MKLSAQTGETRMITIYGAWPSRSFRVMWALEELGLEYRLRPVDLRKRKEDAEFMALNPAGFLPALDDNGVVMVDSVAMLEYIVARYGGGKLAPAPDDAQFPAYQQFLHLGESGMAAYLNIVVGSRFFAPEDQRDNWGARIAVQMFFNRLTLVSRHLEDAKMMAGDTFTAADISVTYALGMAENLGLADGFGPEIVAYRSRMAERGAYKTAHAKWAPPPKS
jgi:glutathione S-transferase